jgi:tetratricopeptide (TPR) repeat protein
MEPMLRPPVPPLDGYDAALDRIHGKIARDELKGLGSFFPPLKSLHAEIFENTFVQMLLTMHSTRRIAELSLCDVLLRQQRTAGLALQVAETFHQSLYGTPVVQDPHAWSWDAPESPKHERGEDALAAGIADKVRQLLAWGPDPSERAALLTLQATVEGARRRAGEAVRLLNRAAAIHRRQGDRHLFGRVLLQKGILLGSAGRHAMALRLLRRSLDLVDPAREPRLVVEGVHHLIWFLSRTGQTPEAEACLHAARRLYERANDRRHLGRLHWLEGRIAARPREAESALIAARDALNREGLGHEAALASLDLGALYVRERREVDVRRQPETVFSLASSGNLLKDSTLLIETAGALTREEPAAPLVENLESWTKDLREKNNPPGLIPRL